MNAQQIGIDNAMVVWSIGARSDYQAIVDGLTAEGLAELAPNRKTDNAVREEAAQALAEIEEELTREDITERGVKGQLKRAKELRAKLREYEQDLNISLADVHGKIDRAEQEQATAALIAASSGANVPASPIPTSSIRAGTAAGSPSALFPFMA